jgi:heavy metal sensor kinase
MIKSLRWRLQLWHALILLVVLVGFGGGLFVEMRRTQFYDIDTELGQAAHAVLAQVRTHGRPPGPWDGGRHRGPEGREDRVKPHPHELFAPPDRQDRSPELPARFRQRYEEDDVARPYFAVWRSGAALLHASGLPADTPMPDVQPAAVHDGPEPPQFRQRGALREAIQSGPGGLLVLVGRSIQTELNQLRQLAYLLLATGAGVLGVGLVGGWLISKRAVLPIVAMTATAEAISASNLSQRIDVAETDSELGRLGRVLNAMFDRLEAAFERQVRFTADASHELRTPVSIIFADTELALTKNRSGEEYRQTIETCHRAAKRMRCLVDALLTLARIDSGELVLRQGRFDLGDVATECAELLRPLAAQKQLRWELSVASVEITGDPERIAQVIMNLLTNAVHYNREGGEVRLSVARDTEGTVLTVSDTGIGIPPEDQPHIFERFYRADKARSQELGGSGLGLAICQSIVQAHGGSIALTSEVNQGTRFIVRLP